MLDRNTLPYLIMAASAFFLFSNSGLSLTSIVNFISNFRINNKCGAEALDSDPYVNSEEYRSKLIEHVPDKYREYVATWFKKRIPKR